MPTLYNSEVIRISKLLIEWSFNKPDMYDFEKPHRHSRHNRPSGSATLALTNSLHSREASLPVTLLSGNQYTLALISIEYSIGQFCGSQFPNHHPQPTPF